MNTLKKAINIAKENGYFWNSECQYACDESHLMNPEFWSSLGKGLGWNGVIINGKEQKKGTNTWWHHWHDFIDHLAANNDAESFFKQLLA